jgi:DNA-binding NtrC family response regulator
MIMKPLVLLADDDPEIIKVLKIGLQMKGYDVAAAHDGQQALLLMEQKNPALVFLDIEMPKVTGIEVLKQIRKEHPSLPVVIMTAHGTVSGAVAAMKEGATDFIAKPFDMEHLTLVINKALEREDLKREVAVLRAEIESRYDPILSFNSTMNTVIETARKAAQSDATILLLGESGTGKDVLARTIHGWSARREKLFAPVNCVALSEELLESELFGHEKGAFTGAHIQKLGKLEMAGGGTVFLDEIGDMKPALQAKLLRFLQNREFDRVGGVHTVKVDVRVIAATNQNLQLAIKKGLFRTDLFYRLNIVTLTLPPLRDRKEDIPQLADIFLNKYCREMKRPIMQISSTAMRKLSTYSWPGNVRELQNVIERAVVLNTADHITTDDLAFDLLERSDMDHEEALLPFHQSVETHKRKIICRALTHTSGSRVAAAQLLGLQPTYLSRLIRQLNIS